MLTGYPMPLRARALVTSDATEQPSDILGLYIVGAGNLVVRFRDAGADVTIAVVANSYHPLGRIQFIRATSTATGFTLY